MPIKNLTKILCRTTCACKVSLNSILAFGHSHAHTHKRTIFSLSNKLTQTSLDKPIISRPTPRQQTNQAKLTVGYNDRAIELDNVSCYAPLKKRAYNKQRRPSGCYSISNCLDLRSDMKILYGNSLLRRPSTN